MNIREELYAYISDMKIISTHSHHNYHEAFEGFDLMKLIFQTYPGWGCFPYLQEDINSPEHWKRYFEISACRSDAYWLNKALGDIYFDGTPMSFENYQEIDARIRDTYKKDPYFHEKIITDICGIETLILDEHRDPGMTHGLFFVRPSMRMDWALAADERAEGLLGGLPESFSGYLDAVDALIAKRVQEQGVVAFKLACAYERSLDFKRVSFKDAEKAYLTDKNRDLGDFMVYHTCELAKKYGLPYQFHTGMGQLNSTSAMNLLTLFRDFPDVKFVQLHCSFPWAGDSIAIANCLHNVYVDLAWIFTLSDSMGRRYISEAFEMIPMNKFAWGCDTWTAEEGYGALLAVRHALADEFCRRVTEGKMDIQTARHCIQMILYENPKELYKL